MKEKYIVTSTTYYFSEKRTVYGVALGVDFFGNHEIIIEYPSLTENLELIKTLVESLNRNHTTPLFFRNTIEKTFRR